MTVPMSASHGRIGRPEIHLTARAESKRMKIIQVESAVHTTTASKPKSGRAKHIEPLSKIRLGFRRAVISLLKESNGRQQNNPNSPSHN